jgi:antitoxin component of RelBE/YafQ-DinJ toxin-antitoxin module
MAKMEIRPDSLKAYIDEKVKEAVEDIKQDFIEAMISEIIKLQTLKLQTYKILPYEGNIYVDRDEVLKILEKYTEGDEGDADSD